MIYFIRHTSVNVPKGTCYGQSDVPLKDSFIQEANNIIAPKVDLVFSSPLSRCSKLASQLYPKHEIIKDERLMELDFGDFEMQKWDDLNNEIALKWMNNYVYECPPNGESFAELSFRLENFIDELPKKSLAIITHAGIIRAARCILKDLPISEAFQLEVDYGEVFTF